MTTVKDLHDQAMAAADEMFRLRSFGQHQHALVAAARAFELEMQAANLAFDAGVSVPTRIILLEGAARLAREARRWTDGMDLCIRALQAEDIRPHRVAVLRALDTLRTYEHLDVEGVELTDTDLQISVAGLEAAPGFARADEVMRRVGNVSSITKKTAQWRKWRAPEAASVRAPDLTPYLSVARAASYAVTLRFGVQAQTELSLDDPQSPRAFIRSTLDDVMTLIEEYAANGPDAVGRFLDDEKLTNNVVALLRDIAPDDERIHTVGLTVVRDGKARPIALPARGTFDTFSHALPVTYLKQALPPKTTQVVGQLLAGDATRSKHAKATLVTAKGKTTITYDEDTFDDVIGNYWKKQVVATLERVGAHEKYVLRDVQPA